MSEGIAHRIGSRVQKARLWETRTLNSFFEAQTGMQAQVQESGELKMPPTPSSNWVNFIYKMRGWHCGDSPLGDRQPRASLKGLVHELRETLPKVSSSEKGLHDFINRL